MFLVIKSFTKEKGVDGFIFNAKKCSAFEPVTVTNISYENKLRVFAFEAHMGPLYHHWPNKKNNLNSSPKGQDPKQSCWYQNTLIYSQTRQKSLSLNLFLIEKLLQKLVI
jgi:hypothetical protein